MSPRAEGLAWLVALVTAAGCQTPTKPEPSPVASSAAAPAPPPLGSAVATAAPSRAAAPLPAPFDPEPWLEAPPKAAKSIGHTSVVFKLELGSGKKAAWKPHSRRGPSRYKGEIAAYRLAVALGIANVPPALPRSFPRAELAAVLGGEDTPAGKLFAEEVLGDGARVHGALIPWVDRLEILPLEAEPLASRWRSWLARDHVFADDDAGALGKLAGATAEVQRDLAAQVSTLVVFDALSGNWDRWSGGNVGYVTEPRRILFLDNDGAFFERAPKDALARNERLLASVDRFSRRFVASLRALDDDALGAALGEERPGVPLLDARVRALVGARRRAALDVIDAKIAKIGEAETLAFP